MRGLLAGPEEREDPGNRYRGSIELNPDRVDLLSSDVDAVEVRDAHLNGFPEAQPISEVESS